MQARAVISLTHSLAFALGSWACAPADSPDDVGTTETTPAIYEYVYPYNTDQLIENHYIVLDSPDGALRGWYYGTSDEFDTVREGYLPGFFVAELQELRVADDSIAFTLHAPEMFTAPVPIEYRDAAEVVSRGDLSRWEGPTLAKRRSYRGVMTAGEIVLRDERGTRLFRRSGGH